MHYPHIGDRWGLKKLPRVTALVTDVIVPKDTGEEGSGGDMSIEYTFTYHRYYSLSKKMFVALFRYVNNDIIPAKAVGKRRLIKEYIAQQLKEQERDLLESTDTSACSRRSVQ